VLIAGFGAAAEAFPARYGAAGVSGLLEKLEACLAELAPEVVIFGKGAERLGNVADFAVGGITSAVAMMSLDLAGVSVSSGSACSSGKVGRSHVLEAMGVDGALADCALRVSLGWNSTAADVDGFLAAYGEIVRRHRARQEKAA
jgi:cysteine desulfurase